MVKIASLAALVLFAACSSAGTTSTLPTAPPPPPPSSGDDAVDAAVPEDAAVPGPSPTDGTPTRTACTSSFGSALTTTHGRLDGYLVAIVPESTRGECNNDGSHVHLQVKTDGAVYDIAVNLDTLEADVDAPLPDGAWNEGWHMADALDYPTTLGLHAAAFTAGSATAQRMRIETALANANHVSIFATGYGPEGAHLVHRQGGGRDGAIITDPLAPKAHVMAFRFATDSF